MRSTLTITLALALALGPQTLRPSGPHPRPGALNAESFCERVLSCANDVLTEGNTLLSDEELEMLVVLRMNRKFMRFMREHYSSMLSQQFGQTIIREADFE